MKGLLNEVRIKQGGDEESFEELPLIHSSLKNYLNWKISLLTMLLLLLYNNMNQP